MVELMKRRTTEEARGALSNFCQAVGAHGKCCHRREQDGHVHIFSIPVDKDRDADMILSDVITERDELKEALRDLVEIGKRDTSNPKYDGYWKAAREALGRD